jgi:hypothetical protein
MADNNNNDNSKCWRTEGNKVDADDWLGTRNDQPLRIRTNNTQKMIITPAGNVGIGTETPETATGGLALHIHNPNGASALRLGDGAVNGQQWEWQSTVINNVGAMNLSKLTPPVDNPLTVLANGNVGVGTTAPADRLDVTGGLRILTGSNPIRFTAGWSAFPDAVANQAEISNDTGAFKTLMIVGNRSAGLGPGLQRRVSVWDRLEVNGNLLVTGRVGIGPTSLTAWLTVVDPTGDPNSVAVLGRHGVLPLPAPAGAVGVRGEADGPGAHGVQGLSLAGVGVEGVSRNGTGVFGESTNGTGVFGTSSSNYAGFFEGKVRVTGMLEKPGGGFRIDHPLDPANMYLNHSFVESSEMKNVYDGAAILDETGAAWVELPKWFENLNGDFRYQLTAIGAPASGLHVAEEISENRFKVAGGESGMKVSWQVTGIRQDKWAGANRIEVEEEKDAKERAYYLHPDLYAQPEERGINRLWQPAQL